MEFEREDDIPGFLAPMIYFDFIERKNPEGMLGILKHNEIDILSLITLYTHLTFSFWVRSEANAKKHLKLDAGIPILENAEAAEKVFLRAFRQEMKRSR